MTDKDALAPLNTAMWLSRKIYLVPLILFSAMGIDDASFSPHLTPKSHYVLKNYDGSTKS
jgi:hypothetical protein